MNIEIFFKVFNNKIVYKAIYRYIYLIDRDIYNCKYGDTIKWQQLIDRPDILAAYGYIDLLKQYFDKIKNKKIRIDEYYFTKDVGSSTVAAIIYNRLDILRYMVECVPRDFQMNFNLQYQQNDMMYYAAKSGHVEIIEYLDLLSVQTNTSDSYSSVVLSSPLTSSLAPIRPIPPIGYDKIKWNYDNAFIVSPLSKQLEICQWIYNRSISEPFGGDMILLNQLLNHAGRVGSKDIFEWLLPLPCFNELTRPYLDIGFWREALNSCNIELLDYLYEVKPFDFELRGYILFLEQALEAFENHILLEWLISKGFKFDTKKLIIKCILKGTSSTIKWMFWNLPESWNHNSKQLNTEFEWFMDLVSDISNIIDFCMKYDNLDIIQWIHENNPSLCGKQYLLDEAILKEEYLILEWFTENKRTEEISSDEMSRVIRSGNFEMLKWILLNRSETFDIDVLEELKINNDIEMIEWCTNHSIHFKSNIKK